MLDRYIQGDHERNSPEADIPVIDINQIKENLGGAANVALNLKKMGLNPLLVSVGGKDSTYERIDRILQSSSVDNYIVQEEDRKTTCKSRVIDANYNQFIRLDEEDRHDISDSSVGTLIDHINSKIKDGQLKGIIIQDYNKGVVTENLIKAVQRLCLEAEVPLFVDPKHNHFELLSNCDVFKPNLKECQSYFTSIDQVELEEYLKTIRKALPKARNLVITLGEKGIFYSNQTSEGIVKGIQLENADVSGAGDAVISALFFFFTKNYDLAKMCQLANKVGALSCSKRGIYAIDAEELNEIEQEI